MSDLEETVKRKTNALKNANRRREQAQEAATSEMAQAWRAAQLTRGALEEAGRKRDSFREHARDAEARVSGCVLVLVLVSAIKIFRATGIAIELYVVILLPWDISSSCWWFRQCFWKEWCVLQ